MSIEATEGLNELAAEQLEKWMDPDYGLLYEEEKPPKLDSVKKANSYLKLSNALDSYLFHEEIKH